MVHYTLRKVGALMPPVHGSCNVQNEEEALDSVDVTLLIRTHQISYKTGLHLYSTAVWHTLHEYQLYSFHVQLVLCTRTTARGQYLSHQVLSVDSTKTLDEPDFLCHIFQTDEATFKRSGVNNLHSLHDGHWRILMVFNNLHLKKYIAPTSGSESLMIT